VAEQMRAADLLVTAAQEGSSLFDRSRYVNVGDLVLRAGKPVLIGAESEDKVDLRTVVVGWKNTREARRAVQDALPLLRLAERVVVVEIAAAEDLPDARTRTEDVAGWLTGHGIAASARAVTAAAGDAQQLRNIASDLELDAGLVVGGAYGHTRLREWVLGGVTRDLLLQPTRCSLVSH
jgi:nucleotide-binding universal stress UspA family protein